MLWQTPSQLEGLLTELVSWDSRSGTRGEILFPFKLKEELFKLQYFEDHPAHIELFDAGDERNTLTALYKSPEATDTIIFISHFDTVHTGEFTGVEDLAFKPHELTEHFKRNADDFKEDLKKDILSGEYLFGRGTMDMKMGLALQMHLLERAVEEDWPVNVLLTAVPDEEVDSAGMRKAADKYDYLRDKHDLDFSLFLNCEPSFTQRPNDSNHYIYSGSIGKIMPSALFYGVETHAGEPLKGLNAHYMASFLTQEMELNHAFKEEAYGETTPLPISLQVNDLKRDYSTQTSNHVAALYNVFTFEQSAEDVFDKFNEIAISAMDKCSTGHNNILHREDVHGETSIEVMTYDRLFQYTVNKIGEEKVNGIIDRLVTDDTLDDREKSFAIADTFIQHCKELAPVVITLFTPPYYPSVNNSDNALVKEISDFTMDTLREQDIDTKVIHHFNGISDLSYVAFEDDDDSSATYGDNTPVWGRTYSIPFDKIKRLQTPFINIGPYGKDAHKISERLHKENAFVTMPRFLSEMIEQFFVK